MSSIGADDLALDDVDDVAGRKVEGRTVEILLDDGRVLVTRVRQIQDGPLPCPDPDCFRRFDSERGVKTHVGKFHPERTLRECPTCGEEFKPTNGRSDQVYCSVKCAKNDPSGKDRLVCENCERVFEVKASHSHERRHCSRECQREASSEERVCPTCGEDFETRPSDPDVYCSRSCWRDRSTPNSRETRTCPECGDSFEVYPSRDQQFCSMDCYSASRHETRSCPVCRQTFDVKKGRDKTSCSRWCNYERSRDDRPEAPFDVATAILDEGHDGEAAFGRIRAHLLPEYDEIDVRLVRSIVDTRSLEATLDAVVNDLDRDVDRRELAARCIDLAGTGLGVPETVSGSELVRAIDHSSTIYELTESLRIDRNAANTLVRRLGIELDHARGFVSELQSDDQDGRPDYGRFSLRGRGSS